MLLGEQSFVASHKKDQIFENIEKKALASKIFNLQDYDSYVENNDLVINVTVILTMTIFFRPVNLLDYPKWYLFESLILLWGNKLCVPEFAIL